MMTLYRICGVALISAVSMLVVKNTSQKAFPIVGILSFILIFSAVISKVRDVAEPIRALANASGVTPYGILMLKALGIGLIVHVASDICCDLGSESLGHGVELAGKIEILLLCLPFILEMTEAVKELLS